jgi:hypothetical protein
MSPQPISTTLVTAQIELAGDWGRMLEGAVAQVLERMRHACLHDVRLVSDRQPTRLRVDEHTSGPPVIWLHPDESDMAWIIVDIGERDWSKLAYQFGHELGHVFANSWQADARPAAPCQWLEEAMVEAFSLRGLRPLATGWKDNPPFAGDHAFGDAIAKYRQNIINRYAGLAGRQGFTRDATTWFANHRSEIETPDLNPFAQAMSLTILAEYDRFRTVLRRSARSTVGLAAAEFHLVNICSDGKRAASSWNPPRTCRSAWASFWRSFLLANET